MPVQPHQHWPTPICIPGDTPERSMAIPGNSKKPVCHQKMSSWSNYKRYAQNHIFISGWISSKSRNDSWTRHSRMFWSYTEHPCSWGKHFGINYVIYIWIKYIMFLSSNDHFYSSASIVVRERRSNSFKFFHKRKMFVNILYYLRTVLTKHILLRRQFDNTSHFG